MMPRLTARFWFYPLAVADVDLSELAPGVVLLLISPWLIRRRWTSDVAEVRAMAWWGSRHVAVAGTAVTPVLPLFAALMILSSGIFDGFAWSQPVFAIIFLSTMILIPTLTFGLRPRFLLPPRLRAEQSLVSLALYGPRAPAAPGAADPPR